MEDTIKGIALVLSLAALAVFVATLVLQKILFLKSPPLRRARGTVGVAYLLAVLLLSELAYGLSDTQELDGYGWLLVLVPVAAPIIPAYLSYRFLLKGLRSIWYENHDDIPEGTGVANDDWRVALIWMAIALLVAVLRKLPVILAIR